VTSRGDGTFAYDPNGKFAALSAGATATDTFRYSVRDHFGGESFGTVTIVINGVNQAPSALDDTLAVNQQSSPIVITPLLLANDTDPDAGDRANLTVSAINTQGTFGIVQLVSGDVLYQPG